MKIKPWIRPTFVVMLTLGMLTMNARAQEGPTTEDLIAPIRAQVADPTEPFDIFIKITLIPGQEQAFEEAFATRMAATRDEPGNILFELSVHPQMPNVYMLHERWANLQAVEEHMGLEHMRSFWPIYFPMIARVPEFEIYTTRDLARGPNSR